MAIPVVPITLNDLTEAKVNGAGAFDTIMRAMVGHLEVEFKTARLRGADYAQVYLSALTPVLQNAVVFLLQKDEAANKAALVQAQIDLTVAQGELIKLEIEREVLTRDLIQAQVDRIRREIVTMDLTDNLVTAQIAQQKATTLNTTQELLNLQAQECLLKAQYDLAMLNKLQTTAQTALIQQKNATERAQIVETGVDENSVVGRQKGLYLAQTEGFKRDSEQKAAKTLIDTWNVRRTTDDATVADATNMLNDATIGRAVQAMLTGAGI